MRRVLLKALYVLPIVSKHLILTSNWTLENNCTKIPSDLVDVDIERVLFLIISNCKYHMLYDTTSRALLDS
jgi:hypothetical protein